MDRWDFEFGNDERKIATQYKLRMLAGAPLKKYDTLELLEKIERLYKTNSRLWAAVCVFFSAFALVMMWWLESIGY